MSIEKLSNDSKTSHEAVPFTQISNHVINNIKNSDAFLVWCYLQSKTSNWKVIKQDIKNKYTFGDKKLKLIFSYLHRANLIRYVQMHCAKGKFAQTDIVVLNGLKFDKNQEFIVDKERCAPVGHFHARAVQGTNLHDELLNKESTKHIKKQNIKNSCASDDAPSRFEEFWNIYPLKKNKKRATMIWHNKKLDCIADRLIEDVQQRVRSDKQWLITEFIPHASTYLQGERWNDETTKAIPNTSSASIFSNFMNSGSGKGRTYDSDSH